MKTVIFLTLVFIVISNSGCNKSENPTENQQNTSIQITTNVSTSLTRIFQDGVSIKSLIGSGTISEIVQGSYTLIIEAQGYKSQSENITIINGQLLQKNVQLIRSSQPMVYISGGTFWMGCTSEQSACNDSEKPIHQVTLSAYEIGIYEIDQSLWNFIMGTNPSMNTGDNKPVEKVNWYDAINFCNNLSLREELTPVYTINGTNVTANWAANGYRLPTEAEWEYAASVMILKLAY